MITPDAVQGMLKTAEGYDQLASRSEYLGWTALRRLMTTVDLWHGSVHPPELITMDSALLWMSKRWPLTGTTCLNLSQDRAGLFSTAGTRSRIAKHGAQSMKTIGSAANLHR
jgi:hypothetical protein